MAVFTTNVDPSFVGWRGREDLNFHFTLSMIVDGIYSTLRGRSKTRGKKLSVQGHWKICQFEGMVELMTLNTLVKWCNDGCLATEEKVIEKISEIRVEIEPTTSITHQRPVSRTSRNFSGDINPFVSSRKIRFKLWNLTIVLPFLISGRC